MKYALLIFVFSLLFFITPLVHAEYVLPYPSVMPGSKAYILSKVFDRAKNYWSFGSIAQSKYHMALADKYLVQAKTLFEYKQYLLALAALNMSDSEITKLPSFVSDGRSEKKDMSLISTVMREEMLVHENLLVRLKTDVPETFIWSPERVASSMLPIHAKIDASVELRKKIRTDLMR